jgi:hypothetical protein
MFKLQTKKWQKKLCRNKDNSGISWTKDLQSVGHIETMDIIKGHNRDL